LSSNIFKFYLDAALFMAKDNGMIWKKDTDDFMNDDMATEDVRATRRKSPRRSADNCITVIDGRSYPVHNWSDGGLLLQADERMFSLAAPIEVTMKFRLSGKIVDIAHRGKVVRKMRDKLAIQFEPVGRDIQRKFKQVVDDYVTREFAESQMA
jgi:hypothetical protein